MITFWIFAIAMVAIALVFILRPLFIEQNKNDIDRTAQNVAITKERLNELKLELEQSVINQTEYEQSKQELELALLNDVEQPSSESMNKENMLSYNRVTPMAILLVVPVIAISFYIYLGQPELIEGGKKQAAVPAGHASSNASGKLGTIEQVVEKLAARLKEKPNSAEGWFLLGRSYMSMKRYKEAVAAFDKANRLIPDNPVVMLRYADALTMLSGGQISGKPFELIKRAVAIKPDDPTGLWLLGMGYEEKGEYQKAISYWNLLMPLLNDDKSITEVQNLIRQAKSKTTVSPQQAASPESVKQPTAARLEVNVTIDKKLLSQVLPSDIVFIFAKAVAGSPMPLAVVRKQVKDLPLQVILDDTMAMTSTMKLSNFRKVQVIARVSKSGRVKTQSGDLQSETRIVTVNKKEKIELTINKLLP